VDFCGPLFPTTDSPFPSPLPETVPLPPGKLNTTAPSRTQDLQSLVFVLFCAQWFLPPYCFPATIPPCVTQCRATALPSFLFSGGKPRVPYPLLIFYDFSLLQWSEICQRISPGSFYLTFLLILVAPLLLLCVRLTAQPRSTSSPSPPLLLLSSLLFACFTQGCHPLLAPSTSEQPYPASPPSFAVDSLC